MGLIDASPDFDDTVDVICPHCGQVQLKDCDGEGWLVDIDQGTECPRSYQ
jgi:hypothetical protein